MLQNPQILQSPARLGLTNPNSPSFSNPTTPKLSTQIQQHHLQQQPPSSTTTTTTTTTTSSALLSLLPPLSRAQTLLLQMASLASKLFELSPNRSLWLSSFRGSLPTFLSSQTLILNPPPIDPPPSSTKEIISLFTSLQTQLFESVAELQEILDLQDAKNKLAREIRNKDSAILGFANKLKEAEHVLDLLVDDYSDYHRPKRAKLEGNSSSRVTNVDVDVDVDDDDSCTTSVASSLNLADILSYAHKISYTTFAPPEFGAGQGPLRGALPPAPQEEQMRASLLYSFADLDVGLPKIESKDKTVETIMEVPAPQPMVLLADLFAKGLPPRPPGWKSGMEIELPKDFPITVPAGWKLGDPVPLPPIDVPVPCRVQEQQQRPFNRFLHMAAGPISVPTVILDINKINQADESGSGASSSEDESSEEDDEE